MIILNSSLSFGKGRWFFGGFCPSPGREVQWGCGAHCSRAAEADPYWHRSSHGQISPILSGRVGLQTKGRRKRLRNFTQKYLRDFSCVQAIWLDHDFLEKVRLLGLSNMLVPSCQLFLTVQGLLWLNNYILLHSEIGMWPNYRSLKYISDMETVRLSHGHFSWNIRFQPSSWCRWQAPTYNLLGVVRAIGCLWYTSNVTA